MAFRFGAHAYADCLAASSSPVRLLHEPDRIDALDHTSDIEPPRQRGFLGSRHDTPPPANPGEESVRPMPRTRAPFSTTASGRPPVSRLSHDGHVARGGL